MANNPDHDIVSQAETIAENEQLRRENDELRRKIRELEQAPSRPDDRTRILPKGRPPATGKPIRPRRSPFADTWAELVRQAEQERYLYRPEDRIERWGEDRARRFLRRLKEASDL